MVQILQSIQAVYMNISLKRSFRDKHFFVPLLPAYFSLYKRCRVASIDTNSFTHKTDTSKSIPNHPHPLSLPHPKLSSTDQKTGTHMQIQILQYICVPEYITFLACVWVREREREREESLPRVLLLHNRLTRMWGFTDSYAFPLSVKHPANLKRGTTERSLQAAMASAVRVGQASRRETHGIQYMANRFVEFDIYSDEDVQRSIASMTRMWMQEM